MEDLASETDDPLTIDDLIIMSYQRGYNSITAFPKPSLH